MAPSKNGSLRREILDRARALLLAGGYSELSMRKIAGAIGCTPTSIYLYFRNKGALVHALVDEGMELLGADLERAARGPSSDSSAPATGAEALAPRARLEELCRAYARFALANPEYYEVMFTLRAPELERYPAEKYRRARRNLELFAEALADTDRHGTATVPDPFLAANVLWSALHGAVALCNAGRIDRSVDREHFLEYAVRHAHLALDAFDSLPRSEGRGLDLLPEENHR